jgi:hypothetical protein
MMRSPISETYKRHDDTIFNIKLIAATALLVVSVFALCGCSAQQDGSVLKVQTGDKTLLDVKKNPEDNVSIDVEVPRVNLRVNQEPDTDYSNMPPPVQPQVSTAPGKAY